MIQPQANFKPNYLRLKDAAAYLGVSPQFLHKLHAMREGPPRIKKGRCVMYSIKALDAWMEADQDKAA